MNETLVVPGAGREAVEPLLNRTDLHVCKHELFALLSVTVPGWKEHTPKLTSTLHLWMGPYLEKGSFQCHRVKMRSSWMKVSPNPIWLLSSNKFGHRCQEELLWSGRLVMCLSARILSLAGGWSEKLRESGRGLPRPPEWVWTCWHLDCWLLASRALKQLLISVPKLLSWQHFVTIVTINIGTYNLLR